MSTWLRLTIVTASVGGGFMGVALTLPLLFHPPVGKLSYVLVATCFWGLYAFVTVSGLIFSIYPGRTRLLFAAFATQIPYVSSSVLTYKFAAGVPAFLTLGAAENSNKVGIHLNAEVLLGSSWYFGLLEPARFRFGVNVFALLMLILLRKATSKPLPNLEQTRNERTAMEATRSAGT